MKEIKTNKTQNRGCGFELTIPFNGVTFKLALSEGSSQIQ